MLKQKKELLENARIERFWASQAFRDEKYANKEAKILERHFPIRAKFYKKEAKLDRYFGKKRLHWADLYERKARRLK